MHNTYQGLSYKGSSGEVIPCFKYSTSNFPLLPLQCILKLPNLTRKSKNIFIPALFKVHRHLYPDRLSISVTQVLLFTHCAFIQGSEIKYMRDQVCIASFLVHWIQKPPNKSCNEVGKNWAALQHMDDENQLIIFDLSTSEHEINLHKHPKFAVIDLCTRRSNVTNRIVVFSRVEAAPLQT